MSQITCHTLLFWGMESWAADPESDGRARSSKTTVWSKSRTRAIGYITIDLRPYPDSYPKPPTQCGYESGYEQRAKRFHAFCASVVYASAAHSHRSATIGSTFVARRAGIQQARSATTMSNNAITATVSGSVTLTP
jgi:hypothetical protein